MLQAWLLEFANDTKVHIALLLVAADLVLGISAAVFNKTQTFKMSFIADILRKDILGKLVPYFALYTLALVAGSEDIVIPGLDFGVLAGAAYALLVVALTGSILNSVRDLGILGSDKLPDEIAGDEGV